jgi:hypothetical protein
MTSGLPSRSTPCLSTRSQSAGPKSAGRPPVAPSEVGRGDASKGQVIEEHFAAQVGAVAIDAAPAPENVFAPGKGGRVAGHLDGQRFHRIRRIEPLLGTPEDDAVSHQRQQKKEAQGHGRPPQDFSEQAHEELDEKGEWFGLAPDRYPPYGRAAGKPVSPAGAAAPESSGSPLGRCPIPGFGVPGRKETIRTGSPPSPPGGAGPQPCGRSVGRPAGWPAIDCLKQP